MKTSTVLWDYKFCYQYMSACKENIKETRKHKSLLSFVTCAWVKTLLTLTLEILEYVV